MKRPLYAIMLAGSIAIAELLKSAGRFGNWLLG